MKSFTLRWAVLSFAAVSLLSTTILAASGSPQTNKNQNSTAGKAQPNAGQNASSDNAEKPNRGLAYYHYSLAHMYEELAMAYSRSDYVTKAVDHLRQAMKYDPNSPFLSVELAELYAQTNRVDQAVTEAEDVLKRYPDNVDARRLLGRIYIRSLGDGTITKRGQQTDTLKKAIDQFEKIVAQDPKDVESMLTLGRLYRFSTDSAKAEAIFKRAIAADPDNDEALVSLAQLYSDLGQSHQAAELLEKASSHNPHPRLLAMLGEQYEQNKEYAKAAEVFRKALEAEKDDPNLMKSLAQDLLFSEQYDEALKVYQDVIKADPQDANSYLRIAQIYRQKREFDKATTNLKKAQALSPDNLEIVYNLALLYEVQGSPQEAIRLLKKLLEDTSKPDGVEYTAREKANRAVFLERLGFLYRNDEKFNESEAAFRQEIAMDSEGAPKAYIQIIETERQARQYQKARATADEAVKKYPDDKPLRMARATLLADLGEVEPSIKELHGMLDSMKPSGDQEKDNDERREVYVSLAQICEHARRFDEALAAIASAEKLSSSKEQKELVYFLWGSIHERNKKIDEAEKQFRRALTENPDSTMTLNYLGYMLADNNLRLDEAIKMIQRALELDPQNGAYMDSLGWAYFKMSKYDLAEQYLLKASQKQSNDATIKDHLADLYFKTNRTREAMKTWQEALNDWKNTLPGDTDPLDVAKVQKKLEDAKVRLAKETGANK